MMKFLHYIEITVLIAETKHNIDAETICTAIHEELETYLFSKTNLSPEELKKGKITSKIEKIKPEFAYMQTMYKTNIKIEKQAHKILHKICNDLDKQNSDLLMDTLETRLDDKSNFYIRIKLDSFIDKKQLILTDKGDCIHIKAKVAAYPSTKENALNVIKKIIQK